MTRPLDEAQQYGEEPGGFATLPLQRCGYKTSRKMASSKSLESFKLRARPIMEPNILTEDQSDEHWRDVIATFVMEELESHCEQKSKKSRMKLARSRKWKWSWSGIDHEGSDAVRLEQLRDQMEQFYRESPRSTTQTEPEETTTQCN